MDSQKLVEDLTGQVRAALGEAEEHAREIVAAAEDRAERLIQDAEKQAASIRAEAELESQQRLTQVRAALASLEGAVGSPSAEIDLGPAEVPEPMPPTEPEPSPPSEPEPMPPEPEIEPPAPAEPDRESPQMTNGVDSGAGRSTDATAARIVAMKMALDGSARNEIEERLNSEYEIEGTDKLLSDVMKRVKR